MQLVVRNTFLNAVEQREEELLRTVSAPTGNQSVDLPMKAVEHNSECFAAKNAPADRSIKEMEFDTVSKPEDHPLSWLTSTPPQSPTSNKAHPFMGFAVGGKPGQGVVLDDLNRSKAVSNSFLSHDSSARVVECTLVAPAVESSNRQQEAEGTRGGQTKCKKGNVLLGSTRSNSSSSTASGSTTDGSSRSPKGGFASNTSSLPQPALQPTIVYPHEVHQGMSPWQIRQVAIPGAMLPVSTPFASGPVMTMAMVVPTLDGALPLAQTPSTTPALHAATIFPATAFPAMTTAAQMCSPTHSTTAMTAPAQMCLSTHATTPAQTLASNMNNIQAEPRVNAHVRCDASRGHAHGALEAHLYATQALTVTGPKSPAVGFLHRWHRETSNTGHLSQDSRTFTKQTFEGRLSIVSEDQVHTCGTQRYAVRFTEGELSSADGVGFIFSSHLPCPKNIQRIVSIFANRTGRICVRAYAEVIRSKVCIKPLELGDWVTLTVDTDIQTAHFKVWPADGQPPSSATLSYGKALKELGTKVMSLPEVSSGYFACVVKNAGVTVNFGS